MSQYTILSNRGGHASAELVRVNDFVVRADAVQRDDQSVKALEQALTQRQVALSETPVML